jgi:hypothetical protein
MNKIKTFLMNYFYNNNNQQTNIMNNEIIELKQLFQYQTKMKDYEYKITNYKNIIRNIQIEKTFKLTSSCSNNSDNEKIEFHTKIP